MAELLVKSCLHMTLIKCCLCVVLFKCVVLVTSWWWQNWSHLDPLSGLLHNLVSQSWLIFSCRQCNAFSFKSLFFQVPFLSSAFSFQYLFFQSPNYFFPTFSSKVHLLCKFFITVNTIPHNIALPSIENGLLNTELLKLKKVQFWSLMMTSMMTALAPEPANPRNFCRHSTGTGTGTGTNPAPVGA